jgi:hypothetical protein
MSGRSASNIVISSTISDLDLVEYILSISSGVTPGALMQSVKSLPGGADTKRLGILSMGASMSIRKVINDLKSKVGVTLPEEWQVNGEINFSMLAMLGHIIFMLDAKALTKVGVVAKEKYIKSIGGVADITHYTEAAKIEGKDERSKILLKWAKQLRGFDASKHRSLLAKKFPTLVKSNRGVLAFFYDWTFGLLWSLITTVLWPLFFAIRIAVPVAWRVTFFAILISLVIPLTSVILPETTDAIADIASVTLSDASAGTLGQVFARAPSEFIPAVIRTGITGSRVIATGFGYVTSTIPYAISMGVLAAVEVRTAITEKRTPYEKEYMELTSAVVWDFVVAKAVGTAKDFVATAAYTVSGQSIVSEDVSISWDALEDVWEGVKADAYLYYRIASDYFGLEVEKMAGEGSEDIPVVKAIDSEMKAAKALFEATVSEATNTTQEAKVVPAAVGAEVQESPVAEALFPTDSAEDTAAEPRREVGGEEEVEAGSNEL